ncbi:hypothetical protein BDQ94DRAFT_135201 [Aspergillus welwitschiae]|uniref:Uncharacterized protein n=2 Tax=Aspergillus TaxID=5052 RepID=A0A3F3QFP7_9EURO|nr:hypothetical protein BDQ94DRAFT_135201 [Aspergillus welwitschiae]RDH37880.1 hypothetical protein BDQ94DRAFT_135201 [Aspergillus welwitschiae]RDK37054.1 hypothetical protein M752DRAFT_107760 [Aspergillus phoenicis ATCC 13157]
MYVIGLHIRGFHCRGILPTGKAKFAWSVLRYLGGVVMCSWPTSWLLRGRQHIKNQYVQLYCIVGYFPTLLQCQRLYPFLMICRVSSCLVARVISWTANGQVAAGKVSSLPLSCLWSLSTFF